MTYGWLEQDKLGERAKELGLNPDIVNTALNANDIDAVRTALQQLKITRTDPYFVEAFACSLLDKAIAQESHNIQDICAVLLDIGEAETFAVTELCKSGNAEALALIRQALNANWKELRDIAASAVIEVQYHTRAAQALQDEVENVRLVAARQLEKADDAAALIQALSNDSALVRRIASWYVGRRHLSDAVKPLIERLKVETDMETLRAVIWSLGILRDLQAISVLEGFIEHPNGLVGTAARIALSKMNYGKGDNHAN